MAKPVRVPKYCLHRASGRAYSKHKGKREYFGKHGTDESIEAYNRFVASLLGGEKPIEEELDPSCLTVAELAAAYVQWADGYYLKNGKPTSKINHIKMCLRALLACHRTTEVKEFGPLALRSIQARLVNEGKSRVGVNLVIAGIVRIFKWGVARELVDAKIHQALDAVESLRKGRTTARECPPVEPVDDVVVDACLEHMPDMLADMVRIQRLCGCRPSEICTLRPGDVDRSGEVWEYRPGSHKNEHRGHVRVIYLGPKAQSLLAKYLLRGATEYCFPTERSVCHSQDSYRQAVQRAAVLAGVEKWAPNQLRHSAATEVRQKFGLESAQVHLGHSKADTTQIYAERNADLAREVARQIG